MSTPAGWPDASFVDADNPVNVPSDNACLALMDASRSDEVWADFLYDGHDHDHARGGLMLLPGAVGTHMSWGGMFPVTLVYNGFGMTVGLLVNLDPMEDEIPHHGFSPDDEAATGWTQETIVPMPTSRALFGDPGDLPAADGPGGLLGITWPSDSGAVAVSVYSEGGVRKVMRIRWTSEVDA